MLLKTLCKHRRDSRITNSPRKRRTAGKPLPHNSQCIVEDTNTTPLDTHTRLLDAFGLMRVRTLRYVILVS